MEPAAHGGWPLLGLAPFRAGPPDQRIRLRLQHWQAADVGASCTRLPGPTPALKGQRLWKRAWPVGLRPLLTLRSLSGVHASPFWHRYRNNAFRVLVLMVVAFIALKACGVIEGSELALHQWPMIRAAFSMGLIVSIVLYASRLDCGCYVLHANSPPSSLLPPSPLSPPSSLSLRLSSLHRSLTLALGCHPDTCKAWRRAIVWTGVPGA